ncbi:hypothetical protein H6G97_30840 [Nostoc flagelliforme FACHB-838]|uniref:C2H2-type domain-containing protein n=1 Tax=Nostoc flagelliforme FACHB-838 TaxID=2692904 RepID=A0ABR8DWA2_9NOSO|nr:hypothetical protein [Nostoc flagelliforme]MBD2533716.1 hypothetical protein [Nostoc flagelliforme FACHB-838]
MKICVGYIKLVASNGSEKANIIIKNIRWLKEQETDKRLQRRIDKEIALQKRWDERVNNFSKRLSIEKFLYQEFVPFNKKHPKDATIQCPICEQLVKQENLLSHIKKTHFKKAQLRKHSGI